jgi:2',3'-cyclic-nucleotide 2'-phosphodiesterase (5'-nucleotidase family)|tara:strand:+ start:1725 stop:2477 length:753 start_codon:yes stop_codon:yes gene_type:complete
MKKALLVFSLLLLFVGCEKKKLHLVKTTAEIITIDSTFAENPAYKKLIAPYKNKMITEINTVISYAPKNINRYDGKLQSSLGNLLADLCYERANVIFKERTRKEIDFSMFNYGGIRASISKGTVTNKNPFELMPFENSLVVVELSGKKVAELVDYFIKNKSAHPLSKNIELVINTNASYQLKINNQKFDLTKNYFVLTSDYLQSGGDKMDFFKNPISLFKTDYKMRHAIIDEFKSLDTLRTSLDNRVILN